MPRTKIRAWFYAVLALSMAGSAHAQLVCTSDRVQQPVGLLERFMNADCRECWLDPTTPLPKRGELVLDWIVPGRNGDDAPLSMGVSPESLGRLEALRRDAPQMSLAVRSSRLNSNLKLRVAQGLPVNDYVAASVELEPARLGPFRTWLLLVEVLPKGAGGSPVPRNLVRNVYRPAWDQPLPKGHPAALYDSRPMQIHEGAKPERLRVIAVVEDARGRIRAIVRSECRP